MKRILVLGGHAAGKTTFIAGLAEYCRASGENELRLVPQDDPSREYLDRIKEYFEAGQWPPATTDFNYVSFRLITASSEVLHLEIIDYPGEVVDKLQRGQDLGPWREVLEALLSVDKVLLLLSVDNDLRDLDASEGFSARRQDAAADLLTRLLDTKPRRADGAAGAGPGLVVIPVVTKADLALGSSDGEAPLEEARRTSLKEHAEALLSSLRQLGLSVRGAHFVSATGPVDQVSASGPGGAPPKPLEPWGFEGLVEELQSVESERKAQRFIVLMTKVLGPFLLVIAAWWILREREASHLTKLAESGSLEELLDQTSDKLDPASDEGAAVRARLVDELDRIDELLASSAPTLSALDGLYEEIQVLAGNPNNSRLGRTKELEKVLADRIEGRYLDIMQGASTYLTFVEAHSEYRTRFGDGGGRAREATEMAERRAVGEKNRMRRAATTIAAASREGIRLRQEASLDFVRTFPDDPRTPDLRVANDVADLLLSANAIRISVRRLILEEDPLIPTDDLAVEFYATPSQSESGLLRRSSIVEYQQETTWEEPGDSAYYDLDLRSARRSVLLAANDPDATFWFSDEDKFGACLLSPLEDFVFTGQSIPLFGAEFYIDDVDDDGALGTGLWRIALNSGFPWGTLSEPLVSEALRDVTRPDQVTGQAIVDFRLLMGDDPVQQSPEELKVYFAFYLSGSGWYADE